MTLGIFVAKRKCYTGTTTTVFDCVGNWTDWISCVNGTQTRTFEVDVAHSPGGEECLHGHNATQTQSCGTPCEGSWGNFSVCDGAQRYQNYTVITPSPDGGLECPEVDGAQRSEDCTTTSIFA